MATFVLVPGAWLGGWCWQDVARPLRRAGHQVVAITLTGLADRAHLLTPSVGLDAHVDDVVGTVVSGELYDVFLVGHSYGGTVITGAAARVREHLRALVYLDASVPADGQSNNDVLPPRIRALVRDTARQGGGGWRVPPPLALDWGLDDDARAWVVPKLTPHPLKSLEDPVHLHVGAVASLPRVFLRTSPPSSLYQPLFERARAEGWPCQALEGGHYAMLTAPGVVATALLGLAHEHGAG